MSEATPGLHTLELEQREAAVPANLVVTSAPLLVAETTFSGSRRTFTSICDEGTLAGSFTSITVDQELFRRALTWARALAGSFAAARTPTETEILRQRFHSLLCGGGSDLCDLFSDAGALCELPASSMFGFDSASLLIQAHAGLNLGDRVKVLGGGIFSNQGVTIGVDALIGGDVTAGANVQIGDRAKVDGNVTAGGVVNRNPNGLSVVVGEVNQGVTITPKVIPTRTVSSSTNNITVNAGQGTPSSPFSIAPGTYGAITINSNNVVSFWPGVYEVDALIVNADVTLNLNQTNSPVEFRTKTNLSFGDRLVVHPGAPVAGVRAQFYSNKNGEVAVGTDISSFPVSLTVPNGTIRVFSRTKVTAPLFGKTVTLEPDVIISTGNWLGMGASGLEFLGYPTNLKYCVTYNAGFSGRFSPQAFGRAPWRALLACAILQFDLALPGPISAELVGIAEQAVIGRTTRVVLNASSNPPGAAPPSSQAGSVDAAVASITGNRPLGHPLFAQLDAASGEANVDAVAEIDGLFHTSGFMTNAQIDAALASGVAANLKVHKSGAGTGVTRGMISAILPVVRRDDDSGTIHFVNQVLIGADPEEPSAGGRVAGMGDSGSLWIQTSTNRLVAMTHTVGTNGIVASRIEDIANALGVKVA